MPSIGGALYNGSVYKVISDEPGANNFGGAAGYEQGHVVHNEQGATGAKVKGQISNIQSRFWPAPSTAYTFKDKFVGSYFEVFDSTDIKAFAPFVAVDASPEALPSGHTADGWEYLLAGQSTRSSQYFGITGGGHADGPGRVRAASGSIASPAFSFFADPDTGFTRGGENILSAVTGGNLIASFNGTGLNLSSLRALQHNGTTVIDPSRGVRFRPYTAAAIADATNAVNTTDKAQGKAVWDSTNHRLMVAGGGAPSDPWWTATLAGNEVGVTPA